MKKRGFIITIDALLATFMIMVVISTALSLSSLVESKTSDVVRATFSVRDAENLFNQLFFSPGVPTYWEDDPSNAKVISFGDPNVKGAVSMKKIRTFEELAKNSSPILDTAFKKYFSDSKVLFGLPPLNVSVDINSTITSSLIAKAKKTGSSYSLNITLDSEKTTSVELLYPYYKLYTVKSSTLNSQKFMIGGEYIILRIISSKNNNIAVVGDGLSANIKTGETEALFVIIKYSKTLNATVTTDEGFISLNMVTEDGENDYFSVAVINVKGFVDGVSIDKKVKLETNISKAVFYDATSATVVANPESEITSLINSYDNVFTMFRVVPAVEKLFKEKNSRGSLETLVEGEVMTFPSSNQWLIMTPSGTGTAKLVFFDGKTAKYIELHSATDYDYAVVSWGDNVYVFWDDNGNVKIPWSVLVSFETKSYAELPRVISLFLVDSGGLTIYLDDLGEFKSILKYTTKPIAVWVVTAS